MEFNANRGGRQPHPGAGSSSSHQQASRSHSGSASGSSPDKSSSSPFGGSHKGGDKKESKVFNLKFASVALLFSSTILVIALLFFLVLGGGSNKHEGRYVDSDKYQAVFLNGGQVYFGQVTDLNNKYLRLVDIYYLRVNQQVQPAEGEQAPAAGGDDISLVKLGCELHGPQDEMLINREQIIFWENLKDNGDVSDAIATYKEENPDGQDCDAPEQGAAPQQGIPQQGAGEDAEGAPGATGIDPEDLDL